MKPLQLLQSIRNTTNELENLGLNVSISFTHNAHWIESGKHFGRA